MSTNKEKIAIWQRIPSIYVLIDDGGNVINLLDDGEDNEDNKQDKFFYTISQWDPVVLEQVNKLSRQLNMGMEFKSRKKLDVAFDSWRKKWDEQLAADMYNTIPLSPDMFEDDIDFGQILNNVYPSLDAYTRKALSGGYGGDNIYFSDPTINTSTYQIYFQTNMSGEDLFNVIHANEFIPMVHAWVEDRNMYKIYLNENNKPAIRKRWIVEQNFQEDSNIVTIVLSEDRIIEIDLERGYFTIELEGDVYDFVDRLREYVPITIGEIENIGIGGIVDLYGVFFDRYTLSDFLSSPKNSKYVVVNDRNINTNLHLVIFSPGDYSSICDIYLENGEIINGKDIYTDAGVIMRSDSKYFVRFNIRNARNENFFDYARHVVGTLLTIYSSGDSREKIIDIYKQYIPNLNTEIQTGAYIGVPPYHVQEKVNWSLLRNIAPTLFVSGYPRSGCVRERQPMLSEKELPGSIPFEIKNSEGIVTKTLYFYCRGNCPHNQIQLKQNLTLSNRDLYPYIPCCFQEQASSKREGSFINNILTTQYLLQPQAIAELIDPLAFVIKAVFDWAEVMRRGLPFSNNALIYAIYYASHPDEFSAIDDYEYTISEIRQELAQTSNLSLGKSELYDYSDEQIYELLIGDEFLDPHLVYRYLEEYFDVNIIMLNRDPERGFVELPRHKIQGAYDINPNRNTVVLFYNDPDDDRFDLLIGQSAYFEDRTSLESQRNWALIDMLQEVGGNLTMEQVRQGDDMFFDLILRQGDSWKDYAHMQWIDGAGKVRLVAVEFKGQLRKLIIQPERPFDCPTFEWEEIDAWSPEEIKERFPINRISWITLNDEGNMVGVWLYWKSFDRGVYVPLSEPSGKIDSVWKNIPVNYNNAAIDVIAQGNVTEMRQMEKISRVILQIVAYAFAIYGEYNIQEFLDEWFLVGDDPDYQYDISNMLVKLPTTGSLSQRLAAIEEHIPTLFHEGKIFLSTERIFMGIYSFLEMLVKDHPDGLQIPKKITGILVDSKDFRRSHNEIIFTNKRNLVSWSSGKITDTMIIREEIKFFDILEHDAFVYRQGDDFFLIQNVRDGDIYRAYQIAYYWDKDRINLGYDAEQFDEPTFPIDYSILQINKKYTLSKVYETEGRLLILQYTDYIYAAVLPLLK